jgi:hypothetical protein
VSRALFIIFALQGLSLSAQAVSGNPTVPRLSWGPYDYLKQGYRNAPWVKDPFYPEAKTYKIMGIISDQMAYINGKWLAPGDKLDGFTIKTISPQGVTLVRNSEIMVLKLKE